MTPTDLLDPEMSSTADSLRAEGTAFAIATVVRTVDATAAKPGAKALLLADGSIKEGWIGGGCVRAALRRATIDALRDGQPKFISLRPEEVLADEGVKAGDEIGGVRFARNGCPSKGSMDIFLEPVLPQPELFVLGSSPVAQALVHLATGFDFKILQHSEPDAIADVSPGKPQTLGRYIVVASQGKSDAAFLTAALASNANFIAFVGSVKKFATLREKLTSQGANSDALAAVAAPAGLKINAVTPDEIALSILAQLVQHRRKSHRLANEVNAP